MSSLLQLADCSDIANIPDEVGPLLESLNKRMDVVCDRGIPQGSQRGRDARDDARGQLHEMKARIKTVVDKCEAVANVMDKVQFFLALKPVTVLATRTIERSLPSHY